MTDSNRKRKREEEKNPVGSFSFDIICSDDMMERFLETFSPSTETSSTKRKKVETNESENEDTDTDDSDLWDRFCESIKNVVTHDLWMNHKKLEHFGEHTLGDVLDVSYCPVSQRYIEHYDSEAFTGKLFFADPESDNALFVLRGLSDREILIKSLERDGCHFFGMTRGYDYILSPAQGSQD